MSTFMSASTTKILIYLMLVTVARSTDTESCYSTCFEGCSALDCQFGTHAFKDDSGRNMCLCSGCGTKTATATVRLCSGVLQNSASSSTQNAAQNSTLMQSSNQRAFVQSSGGGNCYKTCIDGCHAKDCKLASLNFGSDVHGNVICGCSRCGSGQTGTANVTVCGSSGSETTFLSATSAGFVAQPLGQGSGTSVGSQLICYKTCIEGCNAQGCKLASLNFSSDVRGDVLCGCSRCGNDQTKTANVTLCGTGSSSNAVDLQNSVLQGTSSNHEPVVQGGATATCFSTCVLGCNAIGCKVAVQKFVSLSCGCARCGPREATTATVKLCAAV